MIETVLIFALGFLAASLGGLLLLPALNARAARLARRRAEARLPLSPGEIAAERDFLRAQFAVTQRRLERAAEAARAKRHADMAAIGAGAMKAAALARDVAARDGAIDALEARGRALDVELADARADGAVGLATLNALEEAHADLLDDLLAARRAEGEVASGEEARGDAAGEAAGGAMASPGPSIHPSADPSAERDDLRASLAAAEQALARALAERVEAAHGNEAENADLRRRIAEVADAITGQARPPRAAALAAPEPAQV